MFESVNVPSWTRVSPLFFLVVLFCVYTFFIHMENKQWKFPFSQQPQGRKAKREDGACCKDSSSFLPSSMAGGLHLPSDWCLLSLKGVTEWVWVPTGMAGCWSEWGSSCRLRGLAAIKPGNWFHITFAQFAFPLSVDLGEMINSFAYEWYLTYKRLKDVL